MDRLSYDELFIKNCDNWTRMSTCVKIQTAAIIVKDKRPLCSGFNGVCAGKEHCVDYWKRYYDEKVFGYSSFDVWIKSEDFLSLHHEWALENELHAERNAINHAARIGVSINGSTIYTFYSPCIDCAKSIVSSGIIRVVYRHEYDRKPSGLKFCKDNGIECFRI